MPLTTTRKGTKVSKEQQFDVSFWASGSKLEANQEIRLPRWFSNPVSSVTLCKIKIKRLLRIFEQSKFLKFECHQAQWNTFPFWCLSYTKPVRPDYLFNIWPFNQYNLTFGWKFTYGFRMKIAISINWNQVEVHFLIVKNAYWTNCTPQPHHILPPPQYSQKKFHPPQGPPHVTQKSGPRSKIKNPLCQSCLAHQQLSKMVWHDLVAPMSTELLHFREKDGVQAQANPGGDWVGVLPTQKLLETKLASLENPFKSYS